MILEAENISLYYGDTPILTDVSFQINEQEHVSLTGYNGSGKTTLLNILCGRLSPSGGTLNFKHGLIIGYLEQTSGLNPENTVYSEMESVNNADRLLERMKQLEHDMGEDPSLIDEYSSVILRYETVDGYNLGYNIKRILNGMGFPPETHQKSISVLSGGEKTRLALAKLLIMLPDLLVLDEPTNHLDMNTLSWLEDYLESYSGAVLTVSHDRYFLDRVTQKTVEIQNGKSYTYNGNFTTYLRLKQEREAHEKKAYDTMMAEAEKLRTYAEKNMARDSTSNMAKSRLKMLRRLDLTAPDSSSHEQVKFSIEPASEPYKDVITFENLTIKINDKSLISDLSMIIQRGEKWAVIGANGTGKTTLLNTILGKKYPASGRIIQGGGVRIGLLEQNLFGIYSATPLDYIRDMYPTMTQLEIRSLLASVGFRGDDVFKSSSGLSGGELARLNLARLRLEAPNLLLLDEPTNHLDIYTRETLYEALRGYTGTIIAVTHDRYLIDSLNCKILSLENRKAIIYSDFGHYRSSDPTSVESLTEKVSVKKAAPTLKDVPDTGHRDSKELRRERAKERERRQYLENRIEELETDIAFLREQISRPEIAVDSGKLLEYCSILESEKAELDVLENEWLNNYSD